MNEQTLEKILSSLRDQTQQAEQDRRPFASEYHFYDELGEQQDKVWQAIADDSGRAGWPAIRSTIAHLAVSCIRGINFIDDDDQDTRQQ